MNRILLVACVTLSFQTSVVVAAAPAAAIDDNAVQAPLCRATCVTRQGHSNLWWGNTDYLLWWFKDAPPRPLVIGAPRSRVGPLILGAPGVDVLIGGNGDAPGAHSGGRFALGRWLDAEQTLGVEGTYFFLGNRSVNQSVTSKAGDSSELAISFYDPTIPGENAASFANRLFDGTAAFTTTSHFQGWEITGVAKRAFNGHFRRELLGGFRSLNLREDLSFAAATATSPASILGLLETDSAQAFENFKTRNSFYGAQAGIRGEYSRGMWSIQGTGKLAMGNIHETVGMNGAALTMRQINLPAPSRRDTSYTTDFGQESRNRFAVIPEVNLNLGVQLTNRLRARIGYSFLYVSRVARPGNQVDRVINGGFLFGSASPAPQFNPTDFWAQGLSAGLELIY